MKANTANSAAHLSVIANALNALNAPETIINGRSSHDLAAEVIDEAEDALVRVTRKSTRDYASAE